MPCQIDLWTFIRFLEQVFWVTIWSGTSNISPINSRRHFHISKVDLRNWKWKLWSINIIKLSIASCKIIVVSNIPNNCKSKTCEWGHPQVSRSFSTHSTSKFSEPCAYQHKTSKANVEINILVTKKSIFEKKPVNVLSEKVAILEEKLQSKYNESNPSSKQIFQCDYGNYKASTKSVLKRHITSKQKENITIPKKEWSKGQDSSLLITIDERAETLYSPP